MQSSAKYADAVKGVDIDEEYVAEKHAPQRPARLGLGAKHLPHARAAALLDPLKKFVAGNNAPLRSTSGAAASASGAAAAADGTETSRRGRRNDGCEDGDDDVDDDDEREIGRATSIGAANGKKRKSKAVGFDPKRDRNAALSMRSGATGKKKNKKKKK